MVLARSRGDDVSMHASGARDWVRATRPRPALNQIQGRRLLYVDDDPLLRRFVTRLLARAGGTCCPAGTHDEAVGILRRDPQLELAILDFHMPDGDIAQLVPRLRAVRPGLFLVGTSGADRCRDFAECGVTRFIPKPWGLAELLRVVDW
jgi:DNA-binding response OmpR family regulator